MSGAALVDDVYATIEESARLLRVPCSRDRIWPVLTAYGTDLADAGMVLSVSTDTSSPSDLDYTLTVPAGGADPYTTALAHGFVTGTDHAVGTLLSDIRGRVPVSEYFIDGGLAKGFSKVYAHFPAHALGVDELAHLPSMPAAVAENAALFARHHLGEVAMIGIDYRTRRVNLYFAHLPEAFREAQNLKSLHAELGLSEPAGPKLEFAQKSFRVYVTLDYDSPEIKRICYAPAPVRNWEPSALPVPVGPEVEKFVKGARCAYPGPPFVIAAVKWTPDGEHVNLGPYVRLSPLLRNLLKEVTGESV